MARKLRYISLSTLFGFMLLGVALPHPAAAQGQTPAPSALSHRRPPIEHYYWQFLRHQNELDEWAARQAAIGYDGSALRNHLQQDIGFSDADYALIRASSVRLTGEVKDLDAQAVTVRAAGPASTTSYAQLNALSTQRDADVNAEVSYLRSNLSPEKIAKLEAFMVRFFSSGHAVSRQYPPAQQPVPAAVQP